MDHYDGIRRRLSARRKRVGRRVRELDAPPVENACEADVGWVRWRSLRLTRALERSRIELSMIDTALRRIAQRSYGICIHCGHEIDERELELAPLAATCLRCSRHFDARTLEQMRLQHADLSEMIEVVAEALRAACEEAAAIADGRTAVFVTAKSTARATLGVLRRELAEHFEIEESGGSFEEVLRRAPQFGDRLAALRDEHASFLDRLDALLGDVDAGWSEVDRWREVAAGFQGFVEDLRAHERIEGQMLSRTLSTFADSEPVADSASGSA